MPWPHQHDPVPHTHQRQPPRRKKKHMRIEEDRLAQEMLDAGVVEPSTNPWSSPVVLSRKKDGFLRFCVNYRRLKDATLKDAQPLLRVDDSLESLESTKFFFTLDLQSGYWQVPLHPKDKHNMAFSTSRGKLYRFNEQYYPLGYVTALRPSPVLWMPSSRA